MTGTKRIFTTSLLCVSLLLGSLFSSFASEIIDVDKFLFPKINVKGIRIVSFDTNSQHFKEIHYFVQTTATPLNLTWCGIHFDSECNVNLSSEFKLKGRILTTKGTLKVEGKSLSDKATEEDDAEASDRSIFKKVLDYNDKGEEFTRSILSYKKLEIQSAKHVKKELNERSGKVKCQGDFKAVFHRNKEKEKCIFKNLSSHKTDNKDERGILGELATNLTMLSFGYKGQFAKYGKNNGFDGVFIDESDNPEMFITESKCRERADGAETIMRDNLSEQKIASKIEKILSVAHTGLSEEAKTCLKGTATHIEEFIAKYPEKIFKFAHRIKSDGTCECLVEKFKIHNYQVNMLQTLSPQSPLKDKLLVLNSVTTQICSTEKKKAELFIKSLDGSPEEKLRLMFAALKIEDDPQEEMITIFSSHQKKTKKVLDFKGPREDTESEE